MASDSASWFPDEVATAGRENLDPIHVARYDAKQDSEAAAEVVMLRTLDLPERPTVVDLGAGTGQFALAMAEHAARVVAVDVSPVMLERLRSKLAASPVGTVECVQAGFLTYEHSGDLADVVYSRWALHHLPDFWKAVALTRMAAILRPGGYLRLSDIVYSFDSPDADAAIERWISSFTSQAVDTEWIRAELEEHVRDEHSTFTWLLEPMIERAGFTIEQREYSNDQTLAKYLCRR